VIKETSLEDIKQHLITLGVCAGDNILVHSSLFSFGRITFNLNELIDLFIDLIGSNGTLFVPAYTFQITKNDIYDPLKTHSEGLGVFSEAVRKHKKMVRSFCPIHNHCAIGKQANNLLLSNAEHSLGANSDFEFFNQLNVKIILLGTDFHNSCTYLHHVESIANVPYRKWLKLKRNILINNDVNEIICHYFARNDDINNTYFNRIIPHLTNLITVNAPYGKSYSITSQKLHEKALEQLIQNPYLFVEPEKNE